MIKTEDFLSELSSVRKNLVKYAEALYGEEKRWPLLRKEIMDLLGRNGLERLARNDYAKRKGEEWYGSGNIEQK